MTNLFNLYGKVALVTGASSGLGVQFAKALASQGAKIAITARRKERLEQVKTEIEALGVECLIVPADMSNSDEIKALVEKVVEHFGRIDILVNNAGVGYGIPAESQTDDDWMKTMKVNVDGVYYMAREVGKHMIEQNYGKIINIGSIHSVVAMANSPISAYVTSKGAVAAMTKALANEWAKHNITVNTIGPAYFPSEMTEDVINSEGFDQVIQAYCPMGHPARDGELDGALIYFASDASSYTTGQYLAVDGGWTTI